MAAALPSRPDPMHIAVAGGIVKGYGDWMATKRIVHALKEQFPAAEITLLACKAMDARDPPEGFFADLPDVKIIDCSEESPTVKRKIRALEAEVLVTFSPVTTNDLFASLITELDPATKVISFTEYDYLESSLGFGDKAVGVFFDPPPTKESAAEELPDFLKKQIDGFEHIHTGYCYYPVMAALFAEALLPIHKEGSVAVVLVNNDSAYVDTVVSYLNDPHMVKKVRAGGFSSFEIIDSEGHVHSVFTGEGTRALRIIHQKKVPMGTLPKLFALSEPEVLVTGDQSLCEAIASKGKHILYETLPHKVDLRRALQPLLEKDVKLSLSPLFLASRICGSSPSDLEPSFINGISTTFEALRKDPSAYDLNTLRIVQERDARKRIGSIVRSSLQTLT